MKIAYLFPEKLPSKTARTISIINSANSLSKYIDTTLIYEKSEDKKKIEDFYKLDLKDLKLVPLSKKYIFKSNKIFNFNLNKILDKFDLFYVRHLKQAEYLIKKNKKVIYECHEIFSIDNPKVKIMENFVLKNSFATVFHNKSTQKEVNKIFKTTQKNTVIYNGHGFEIDFIKKDFSQIDKLIYIGSLIPWKGVEFLINCINKTDYILNIIGYGKEIDYLKKIANNNINFLGFKDKDNIKNILKNSKITIIPNIKSRYNLFSTPIKLFEYMAYSNIIIAPDFEPIKEIIEDKKNGFLFEAENCEDFLNTLKYIKNLPKEELEKISKNAFLTSKEFTWDKRAQKIANFIKEIT